MQSPFAARLRERAIAFSAPAIARLTAAGTHSRLCALLRALGLPEALPEIPAGDLLAAMAQDKKHDGKTLRLVLLTRIGACCVKEETEDFFGWTAG